MREQQSISWSNHAQVPLPVRSFAIHFIAIKRSVPAGSRSPVLLARLALVDYHHVHYPDDGRTLHQDRLGRRQWTVNWRALQSKPNILFSNERNINILETRNFGRLGFVEVGALSVGRIVQVHPLDVPFQCGEEKSVFRFGGSAIVVFGEPGAWRRYDRVRHSELAQHRANCSKKAEVIFREIGSVTGAKTTRKLRTTF
jgi:phosphatidylserine decarboxylase